MFLKIETSVVYSKCCLPVIERHLKMGLHNVSDMFPSLNVATVNEQFLREADLELTPFFNVNTPNFVSIVDAMCIPHARAS